MIITNRNYTGIIDQLLLEEKSAEVTLFVYPDTDLSKTPYRPDPVIVVPIVVVLISIVEVLIPRIVCIVL